MQKTPIVQSPKLTSPFVPNKILNMSFHFKGRTDEPADGSASDHRHPHQRRPGRHQRRRNSGIRQCRRLLHGGHRVRGAAEDQREPDEGQDDGELEPGPRSATAAAGQSGQAGVGGLTDDVEGALLGGGDGRQHRRDDVWRIPACPGDRRCPLKFAS